MPTHAVVHCYSAHEFLLFPKGKYDRLKTVN